MSGVSDAPNPLDPRAPSQEQWDKLSIEERTRVMAQLPSEVPCETAPEGDPHRDPKEKAVEALREYYRRLGRRVYLSAELPVYYPAERMFAPDVIAVVDVEPHQRMRWVVSHEGRGIDFALEITLEGDRKKDLEDNVERYARLGIEEYFVLDLKLRRILGYRLGKTGTYEAILPQSGRWPSRVLGLDLAREDGRVRFYAGSAALPYADEIIESLENLIVGMDSRVQALAEEREAMAEKAERLAAKLRELGVDPEGE